MKKYLLIGAIVAALFSGCGGDVSTSSVNNSVATQTQTTQAVTLPSKISALPSIGATRAEIEKYHRQTASNGPDNIRYDNDEYLVMYIDGTDAPNVRAGMFTIQGQRGKNYNLDDYIPSDAQDLKSDNVGSDNMMIIQNIEGTSEALAQIYPDSEGHFGAGFCWDRQTNAFISANFIIEFPTRRK